MSKYRVEFTSSVLAKVTLCTLYGLLLVSVCLWQPNTFTGQLVLQVILCLVLAGVFYRHFTQYCQRKIPPVTFDQQGLWTELEQGQGSSWRLTSQSRLSGLLIFIHLVSALNAKRSKRLLLFKDQMTEQDYRRLCRAVIYQQQSLDTLHK